MLPISSPDGRCVQVEVDGEGRWGGATATRSCCPTESGSRGDRPLPRARRAVEDHRRAPDLRQPRPRVRGPDAAGALVLHEAADDTERAPATRVDGPRRPIPQLRGRAGRRDREAMKGVADREGARSRRRVHVCERRRHARFPPRRPRSDAASQGPRRVSPARPRPSRRGGRPDRPVAADVRQRRGRARGYGGRPRVPGGVPGG